MKLKCINCGQILSIHERYSGQTGKCKHCGAPVEVPSLPANDSIPVKPADAFPMTADKEDENKPAFAGPPTKYFFANRAQMITELNKWWAEFPPSPTALGLTTGRLAAGLAATLFGMLILEILCVILLVAIVKFISSYGAEGWVSILLWLILLTVFHNFLRYWSGSIGIDVSSQFTSSRRAGYAAITLSLLSAAMWAVLLISGYAFIIDTSMAQSIRDFFAEPESSELRRHLAGHVSVIFIILCASFILFKEFSEASVMVAKDQYRPAHRCKKCGSATAIDSEGAIRFGILRDTINALLQRDLDYFQPRLLLTDKPKGLGGLLILRKCGNDKCSYASIELLVNFDGSYQMEYDVHDDVLKSIRDALGDLKSRFTATLLPTLWRCATLDMNKNELDRLPLLNRLRELHDQKKILADQIRISK